MAAAEHAVHNRRYWSCMCWFVWKETDQFSVLLGVRVSSGKFRICKEVKAGFQNPAMKSGSFLLSVAKTQSSPPSHLLHWQIERRSWSLLCLTLPDCCSGLMCWYGCLHYIVFFFKKRSGSSPSRKVGKVELALHSVSQPIFQGTARNCWKRVRC